MSQNGAEKSVGVRVRVRVRVLRVLRMLRMRMIRQGQWLRGPLSSHCQPF